MAKVQERIVHNSVMDHALSNELLSFSQYGFRPGSSTQEAILAATRDWHQTLECGGNVACVFLDLSKAFDSLPHSLILRSLSRIGVCGELFDWFANYLTGRSQWVALKGVSSASVMVISGVPQGSILGPLLFNLSLDPLTSLSISGSGVIRIYADDINYYKPIFSSADILSLQQDIDTISVWLGDSGLRLNARKTKSMVISRKRKPPTMEINLNGCPVEQVSSFKFLGVTVSSTLDWSLHIQCTCSRVKKILGVIYRSFGLADQVCISRLYKTLVRSVLEYCDCVWDPYQAKYINMLEGVQSLAAGLLPAVGVEVPQPSASF